MLEPAKDHLVADSRFIAPGHTFTSITEKITSIVLSKRTPISWFIGFAVGFTLLQALMVALVWILYKGVGVWGINQPIGWGFAIINFVW